MEKLPATEEDLPPPLNTSSQEILDDEALARMLEETTRTEEGQASELVQEAARTEEEENRVMVERARVAGALAQIASVATSKFIEKMRVASKQPMSANAFAEMITELVVETGNESVHAWELDGDSDETATVFPELSSTFSDISDALLQRLATRREDADPEDTEEDVMDVLRGMGSQLKELHKLVGHLQPHLARLGDADMDTTSPEAASKRRRMVPIEGASAEPLPEDALPMPNNAVIPNNAMPLPALVAVPHPALVAVPHPAFVAGPPSPAIVAFPAPGYLQQMKDFIAKHLVPEVAGIAQGALEVGYVAGAYANAKDGEHPFLLIFSALIKILVGLWNIFFKHRAEAAANAPPENADDEDDEEMQAAAAQ